ncbi:MAG: hypothetical protein L0Z53_28235 [Acidobacteriales bacterium]|nr:hypothetical protein [Terriglobales bacterium]
MPTKLILLAPVLMGALFCLQGIFTIVTGRNSSFYGWWPTRKKLQEHKITVRTCLSGLPFVGAGLFLIYVAIRALTTPSWGSPSAAAVAPAGPERQVQSGPVLILILGGLFFLVQGVWLLVRPKRALASLAKGDEESYTPELLSDPRAQWTVRIIGAGFVILGLSLIVSNR